MNNYPPEIQSFIDKYFWKANTEIQIMNYERYENIYEVEYKAIHPDNSYHTSTVYIRIEKENRMSDSDLGAKT